MYLDPNDSQTYEEGIYYNTKEWSCFYEESKPIIANAESIYDYFFNHSPIVIYLPCKYQDQIVKLEP